MFDDSRRAWGARAATSVKAVPITSRTEFFNHWDGGPTGLSAKSPHSACLAKVAEFQRDHMVRQGWSDIGYNGLVCPHGRKIEGRGIYAAGAHCPDHNTSGLGFQFMIGKGETATPVMFAAMRELYDDCSRLAGRQLAKKGHRDGFATECPGDQIQSWVKAGMAGGKAPAPATPEDDMPLTQDDAKTLLTGSAVMKNPFAANPDAAPRVAASFLLEQTAKQVTALSAQVTALSAAVKALAASKPGVDPAAVVAAVKQSVDAALADVSITLSNK